MKNIVTYTLDNTVQIKVEKGQQHKSYHYERTCLHFCLTNTETVCENTHKSTVFFNMYYTTEMSSCARLMKCVITEN